MSIESLTARIKGTEVQAPPKRKNEPKKTPEMCKAICKLVAIGMPVTRAAHRCSLHHSTVAAWREKDPDFDDALRSAEAEFIESNLITVRLGGRSWQSSAWLLERRFPADFAQPQVQAARPNLTVEFNGLDKALERLKDSPVARQIMEHLADLNPRGAPVIDVTPEGDQ